MYPAISAPVFPVTGTRVQRPDFKKLMGQAMGFMKFKKDAALQQGSKVPLLPHTPA